MLQSGLYYKKLFENSKSEAYDGTRTVVKTGSAKLTKGAKSLRS